MIPNCSFHPCSNFDSSIAQSSMPCNSDFPLNVCNLLTHNCSKTEFVINGLKKQRREIGNSSLIGNLTNRFFIPFLLVSHSNWTKSLSSTLFQIFASKYIWVKTLTCQGHVTSPVTWPYDTPCAISYSCSIVTKSLSPQPFSRYWGHDLDLCRSCDVTNRFAICHFLLVSHWNQTSIFNRIRSQNLCKRAHTHATSEFIPVICPMQCIALDSQ